MTRPTSSPRQTTSRPLARLLAGAVLGAFLVSQSWVLCAPLCLLQGHAAAVMAASDSHAHVKPCHSDHVMRSESTSQSSDLQTLGLMLPTRSVPVVRPLPVVTLALTPPTAVHLQQVSSVEPPPPRLV